MQNNSSDPFIIECFGTNKVEEDPSSPIISGREMNIFMLYFIAPSIMLFICIFLIHEMRKSHCLSQETADALIEEMNSVRVNASHSPLLRIPSNVLLAKK